MKYYVYNELLNAKIYDCEALHYGYICGYEVRNKPLLKACLFFNVGEYVPDVDTLRIEIKSRGIEVPEEAPLEDLVAIARSEGIKIPYVVVRSRLEMVKGFLDLNDVAVIDVCYKPELGYDNRVAVVILNKPREARYRGFDTPLNNPIPEQLPKIKGKLVVSLDKGILGFADEVVFTPGDYGLRVDSKFYRSGYIQYGNIITVLESRGLVEVANALKSKIMPRSTVDLRYYGLIHDTLTRFNLGEEYLNLLIENTRFEEEYTDEHVDISWNNILKIGDVVLTK